MLEYRNIKLSKVSAITLSEIMVRFTTNKVNTANARHQIAKVANLIQSFILGVMWRRYNNADRD